MSADSIKEIVLRFIKTGVISDEETIVLENAFKSSGFDKVSFSDDEKKQVGEQIIKILEEGGITMTANDSDEITVKMSGKDMTYNVKTKIITNNMPAMASPAKDAASKNAASKNIVANPSGFGSSSKRFGGKKTRKQQKGGDPATIGLFSVLGAFYLFCCVWGFYKDKIIPQLICASPAIVLVSIPFIIYDTLRNKDKEPTPVTNEDPNGAKPNGAKPDGAKGATIGEASPFDNIKNSYGGRKSRRSKTRKQKRRRNKK